MESEIDWIMIKNFGTNMLMKMNHVITKNLQNSLEKKFVHVNVSFGDGVVGLVWYGVLYLSHVPKVK